MTKTRPRRFLGAPLVFGAALLLRLGLLLQMRGTMLFEAPTLDAKYYDQWAMAIAGGDWKGGAGAYFMSPGYPYLLAAMYRLFGHNYGPVLVLQSVVGALSCALAYFIARRFMSTRASVAAGLLLACCGSSVFYSELLLKAVWIEFLNVAAVLALLRAVESEEASAWLWPGLLIGLSSQFRPVILAFFPLALLCAPRRPRPLAALCVGLLLTLFPMTTANSGINFYIGADPGSAAPYRTLPFARSDPKYEQADFQAEAERREGRALSAAEASDYWLRQAWSLIAAHPARWAALEAKKAWLLANDYEQPSNQNFYFWRSRLSLLWALSPAGYGLLAPLGFLGFFLTWRRREWRPLHFYFIACLAGLMIFFAHSEYRHPLTLALAVYAAFAASRLVERRGRIGTAGLLVFAAGAVAGQFPTKKSLGRDYDLAVAENNLGLEEMERGRLDEAAAGFAAALRLDPGIADAHDNLAIALWRQGRRDEAVEEWKAALRQRPDYPEALNNLGAAYAQMGRLPEAVALYQAALSLRPQSAPARKNLALAYAALRARNLR